MSAAVSESLRRHKSWLNLEDCSCPFGWTKQNCDPYGRCIVEDWSRLSTHKDCPIHGWEAQRRRDAEFAAGVKRLRPKPAPAPLAAHTEPSEGA